MPYTIHKKWLWNGIGLIFFALLSSVSCQYRGKSTIAQTPTVPVNNSFSMKFVIQVGAFSSAQNALRLVDKLNNQGYEAYYFVHTSKLFKVRIGNFPSRKNADRLGNFLIKKEIIDDFFIIPPENIARILSNDVGREDFRSSLVRTAKQFLGYPYVWGHASPKKGFDCSGLTMAVYRLNGIYLSHSSQGQYKMGRFIDRSRLKRGDLVFFSAEKRNRVHHVGIYVGEDRFIHAPSSNKFVRYDSLNNSYYRARFMGARTYL
mgnify:CR=1 FL=1